MLRPVPLQQGRIGGGRGLSPDPAQRVGADQRHRLVDRIGGHPTHGTEVVGWVGEVWNVPGPTP
jgi:hypothetical protein